MIIKQNFSNNWQKVRLSEICKIISGSTPRTSESLYWNGEIGWVTPYDLSKLKDKYISNGSRNITEVGLKSCSAELLPANSLIMSSRAPIGYFAINKKPVATNQGCKSFICDDSIDTEFLYYSLNQVIDSIKKVGSGSTFAEVGKSSLEKITILVPKKSVQQKIALILSTLDEEIQKTDQIIQKTEKLKNGLMNKLFNEGIYTLVKEISIIKRGASPRPISDPKYFNTKKEGRCWIRISDVTSSYKYLNKTTQYLSPIGESCSVKVNPGDLIMSICATVGKPIIIQAPSCIHDGFVLFDKIDSTRIVPEYLFYLLLNNQKSLKNKGQTGSQMNLNTEIVKNISIKIPSIKFQNKAIELLSKMDNKIIKDSIYKEKLFLLKNGLMNDIFSQKVEVN